MSADASFILLPKAALPAWRAVATRPAGSDDSYHEFLELNGREVATYPWSGYVLATLLPCLEEEAEIHLTDSAYDDLAHELFEHRETAHFILTADHKANYLDRLDPDAYGLDELKAWYVQFNELDDPEAGEMMRDGIAALRDSLSAVDDDSVVVLIIG